MSSRADVIIEDFGKTVGIDNMKFDNDGLCSIKVDGKYNIFLCARNEEALFFYGMIGKVSVDNEKLFSLLLSTNLYLAEANLPTLGYDPKTSALVLAKSYMLDGMDAVFVESIIDHLSDQMKNIEENIRESMDIELARIE